MRPLVIRTRMEHHSNDLPWRETIADTEYIGFDKKGHPDWRGTRCDFEFRKVCESGPEKLALFPQLQMSRGSFLIRMTWPV